MKRWPHVLLLGQYPLDRLDRAPKVRIYQMAQALAKQAEVTLITGSRSERAPWLRRALRTGLLDNIDAVYVESASSTATPVDLWFLREVARRSIPMGIFIRDAYQRFSDLYPPRGVKQQVLRQLYDVSLYFYRRYATILYFPTSGLSDVVRGPRTMLLPPGGRVIEGDWSMRDPRHIVYVGAGGPYDGVDLLLEAMALLHRMMPEARLTLIMRRNEWPNRIPEEYVTLVQASGEELKPYLQSAALAVIPRPSTAYTRIAFPVKLMEYLSFGLPVVATGPSEAARFVETEGVGIGVAADAGALAAALDLLLKDPARLRQMADTALDAVKSRHLWDHRARTVLESLLKE